MYIAGFGAALTFLALCYAGFYKNSAAWQLFMVLLPALIVFICWMIDSAALQRRIKRLETRSEIADERRVTTHTELLEVEHKLSQIENRVVSFENPMPTGARSGQHNQEPGKVKRSASPILLPR